MLGDIFRRLFRSAQSNAAQTAHTPGSKQNKKSGKAADATAVTANTPLRKNAPPTVFPTTAATAAAAKAQTTTAAATAVAPRKSSETSLSATGSASSPEESTRRDSRESAMTTPSMNEATIQRLITEALEKQKREFDEQQREVAKEQKRVSEELAALKAQNEAFKAEQTKLKEAEERERNKLKEEMAAKEAAEAAKREEINRKQQQLERELVEMQKTAEGLRKEKEAEILKQKELEERAASEKRKMQEALENTLRMEKEKFEAQRKADDEALKAKILAFAKEQAKTLELEMASKGSDDDHGPAATTAAAGLPNKKVSEKPSQKELLLRALKAIVDNPSTVIKPKPVAPGALATDALTHYMSEPFSNQEEWIKLLPRSNAKILCRIVTLLEKTEDHLKINFETILNELRKETDVSDKEISGIEVDLQINDLDKTFGIGSRTKRHLSSEKEIDHKKNDEHSLICGLEKEKKPIAILFGFDANGKPKIANIVQRDADEYISSVSSNIGVFIVAKDKENTVVGSTRKNRG